MKKPIIITKASKTRTTLGKHENMSPAFLMKGEMLLLFATFIWGTGFVATDIALDYMSPFQTMALRFFVGAVILLFVFWKKLLSCENFKQNLFHGSILGMILFSAFALQTVGLKYTTPANNAFITGINVIFVPIIGLFYLRGFELRSIIAAVLALVGVSVLSYEKSQAINIGDLLTLGCALAYAFHIFYISEFLKKGSNAVFLSTVQLVVSFALSLAVITFSGELSFANVEPRGIYSVIYLGIFSTAIAFLLQTLAQKRIPETRAAIIMTTEALFGALFSIILGRESFTLKLLIGGLVIIAAILIAETKIVSSKHST